MSYLVCHVQKFKASGVKGMQIHSQRESKNSKNLDIDPDKTEFNYDLHNPENINYNHKVKEIIKDGYIGEKAIRKDAVVMTGTLISSDAEYFKTLSSQEQKKFFEGAYDKLKEIYGEKNIVSAVVHMDETTPHMHLFSIPLTDQGKLSAKTLFNRRGLLNLQKKLPAYLKSKGFDIQRGEVSERNHIEINDFKKQTLKTKAMELDSKLSDLELKKNEVKHLEDVLDNAKKSIKNDLEPIQALKVNLTELDNLKVKKSFIGANMSVSEGDFNQLYGLAKEGIINSPKLENLNYEINKLKTENQEYRKAYNISNDKIQDYKTEIQDYKTDSKITSDKLNALNKTLRVMEPADRNHFLEVYNEKLDEIQRPPKVIQKVKTQDFELGM